MIETKLYAYKKHFSNVAFNIGTFKAFRYVTNAKTIELKLLERNAVLVFTFPNNTEICCSDKYLLKHFVIEKTIRSQW